MKISRKRSSARNRRWWWAGIIVIVFVLGLILGQMGLVEQTARLSTDLRQRLRPQATASDLPSLTIDMAFDNFNAILEQRAEALDRGVFIGDNADFVPATITVAVGDDTKQVAVLMRLAQGPAGALGPGDKWSFEVQARDDALLDMQRFTLQDPAANNWLNQWAFEQILRMEGILAARYRLVNLTFNGEQRGLYAVQEGLSDQLLEAQGKPAGIMLAYAPERLWETISLFGGDASAALADPVANLSRSDPLFYEVDVVREASLATDAQLSRQIEEATALIARLQAGQLTASQVFDVEVFGRFLALVDLWGAMDALSLSNLGYYYDAGSGRLEPIASNANPLSSEGRISPAAFYDDPALQAAYARTAQRISQPAYLEQVRSHLEPELERLRGALTVEHQQQLPWEALAERQADLRRSFDPVQSIIGYVGPATLSWDGVIQVEAANILNLPLEVIGFDINGATFLEASPEMIQGDAGDWLYSAEEGSVVLRSAADEDRTLHFVRFHLSLRQLQQVDDDLDYSSELEIYVMTRILGLDATQLTRLRPSQSAPIPTGMDQP